MDTTQIAKELGRQGGKKTLELYGKNHFRMMQALGVRTKLAKRRQKKDPLDKR